MNMQVWQKIEPTFFEDDRLTAADVREHFEHVADVETDDLDVAYRLTNTIDHPWWRNAGVKALKRPCRSTSMGDVIVDRSGRPHQVAMFGFKELA